MINKKKTRYLFHFISCSLRLEWMDTEDELYYIIAQSKEAASVQVLFMKSYRRAIPQHYVPLSIL